MNILIFSWRDPSHPNAGGAEQVIHEHAKGWVMKGHRVTLFSSRFRGSNHEEVIDGVKIIRAGHQYLGVQVAAFFFYIKNKKAFDFIVDQFHGIPFFTPLYSQKKKMAVIQEVAKEVWFYNPFVWPLNWIVGILGFIIEPMIFSLYKNVTFMTGSESALEDVVSFGIPRKNITVVPHGVIVKTPDKILPKEEIRTVIFLGVLTKDKGVRDAIESFAILKADDYQFWVIGKADSEQYMHYLQDFSKKLKIKNIKFWGFVTQEKKFELLARSHILINPSVREGWGLVNIEANAMGTPVIAYNSPGLIDSVCHNYSGIICKQNTPQCLAENIESILNEENGYKKLCKGAIAWSKKFSWEQSRNSSNKLINKVMQN